MSKTVTFTADVFPYCVGDVVVLSDDELKQVDKIAKARKQKVYDDSAQSEVDSSAEADRQEADRKLQEKAHAESEAQVELEEASAEHAEAESHNTPSGHTTPGTAAGKKVKTAA